jgi:phosphoserine phosphatase
LRKWQDAELLTLRGLCRQHGILFLALSEAKGLIPKLEGLVHHFSQPATAEDNIAMVRAQIDQILALPCNEELETVLVLDGDKTLAAKDTGALFWQELARTRPASDECPLKDLFSCPMGYSDMAFRQATLLYEEAVDDKDFDTICQIVASSVTLHPEIVSVLGLIAEQKHVGAIVVTCGIGLVWNKVLERYGLSDAVKVIGGGRISDGFIVTASVKAFIVSHLQDAAHLYVWAFGDSPLDIPMLEKADQAIVVVGKEKTRSSTMDSTVSEAIDKGELQA